MQILNVNVIRGVCIYKFVMRISIQCFNYLYIYICVFITYVFGYTDVLLMQLTKLDNIENKKNQIKLNQASETNSNPKCELPKLYDYICFFKYW